MTTAPSKDVVLYDPTRAPDPTTEIEAKYRVSSADDLRNLRRLFAKMGHTSTKYLSLLKDSYLEHKVGSTYVKGRPISWYIDDSNMSLSHRDLTVRSRFSLVNGVLQPEVQHCIKGNSQGFNGAGGSVRLEDEITNTDIRFSPAFFSNPATIALLGDVDPDDLYLYLATDVPRNILGVVDEYKGGRSLFEISFDNTSYIAPPKDGGRKHKEFYRQQEVEIEYVNPIDENGDLGRIARAMDLSCLSLADVEEAMERVALRVKDVARILHIKLTPEEISKGRRGFIELEAQRAGRPIPLHSAEALEFLPH